MNKVLMLAAASVAAGCLLVGAAPARAQGDGTFPLIIGSTRLLVLRTPDTLNGRDMPVEERAGHVQDVFAKHLGGKYAKVSWKTWGDRVHIYLNGDFVLAVTPADAQATGYKSASQLAPVWVAAIRKGFNEAHVGASGGAR